MLFDKGTAEPTVVPSVHTHSSWEGKNTSAFYGRVFKQLVRDGSSRSQPTEVARHYTIKIIGLPLVYAGERVGVLKVELPNSYDDGHHYDGLTSRSSWTVRRSSPRQWRVSGIS